MFQKSKLRSDYAFIVGTVLLSIVPLFTTNAYILNIFIISLVFSALAVSYNLIVGYAGIFSFGHHAFFGIGAYVSAILTVRTGISPWLSLPIAGIASAVIGFVIGLPCLRLRAAPYVAIVTLAFAEITRLVCTNLVSLTRGELGLWGIPPFSDIRVPVIGVISFAGGTRVPYYYLILTILIIVMVLIYLVLYSHVGLAFRAIGESTEAAESLGVHITYHKLLAFMISAFFAGIVGCFYAHYLLILTPSSILGLPVAVDIVIFTFFGGPATLMGPILGAFILTFWLEYMRFLLEYRLISYGILLVVIILFLPNGISPIVIREKELVK